MYRISGVQLRVERCTGNGDNRDIVDSVGIPRAGKHMLQDSCGMETDVGGSVQDGNKI